MRLSRRNALRTRAFLLLGVPRSAALVVLLFASFGIASAGNRTREENTSSLRQAKSVSSASSATRLPGASQIREGTYAQQRNDYVAMRRGMPFDLGARGRAIQQMEAQQSRLAGTLAAGPRWTPIGPFSIPNGIGQPNGPPISVSGRVTAIAVDPSNSNMVYIGTANGGVWRSPDGGTSWTPIFDNAQSLAVGALAIAPSSPTTLYVGTGESNLINQGGQPGGAQSFFGVGLYRIDNADTTATLVGPINPQITLSGLTYGVFTGRSISKILVHPTDPAIIFVSTTDGFAGSGGTTFSTTPPMATLGLFRSTNATAAAGAVAFQKLVVLTDSSVDTPPTGNDRISDLVMEPGNPNNLLAGVIATGAGGVYRTTNALAANPTFTRTQASVGAPGLPPPRVALAINKVGPTVTVFAAIAESPEIGCGAPGSGAVRRSTDGGATWSGQLGGYGFCGAQCFYSMAIAVNPNDASEAYLGGGKHDSCGGEILQKTGGTGLVRDDNGLHVDSHVLVYDGAGNIFIGNDGGVWKRASNAAAGSAWTNLNGPPLNTLQFESIAVHPVDRNFTIGGTQDNGTEYQAASGDWHNAESNDGGYALIDQNATDTTNMTAYHNFSHLRAGDPIGFDRITNGSCLGVQNSWPARGDFGGTSDPRPACDGTPFYIKENGLNRNDNSLVYAPMALGPGAPNTLYYGTDRLYRSTDRGDTMTVVSQASISSPGGTGSPLSTIAISPQDDNYRLVGLLNGQVWASSTGSSTLVNITGGSFPANPNGSGNRPVGRAVIDPGNKNVAYVAFSFFAPAGQGVWKITNLGAAAGSSPAAPVWLAAGNGIPSIPINSFVIDPTNSNNLFAGTDIGVYNSVDGGVTWNPYGTGLPRVPVFDMAIQNPSRILRIATFGRGMWETSIACLADATTLCLNGGRFKVQAQWATSQGQSGAGQAVALTSDTGYFWFFSSNNVEMIIKVVDGRALNNKFWVFAAGLTNVNVVITVTDTVTGSVKTYTNPQGTAFLPIQDTSAFAATPEESVKGSPGDSAAHAASLDIASDLSRLLRTDVPAHSAATNAVRANRAACAPDATTLCLNGGRFQVRAIWTTSDGRTGAGQAVPLTTDTGYLWFFSSNNVEMVIKVVDGRALNNKFWVFAGGLTDVNVVVTVTDTQTGVVKTYTNPQGTAFQPIQDTSAFAGS